MQVEIYRVAANIMARFRTDEGKLITLKDKRGIVPPTTTLGLCGYDRIPDAIKAMETNDWEAVARKRFAKSFA